ncbi:hypothetical protein OnM2_087034 [Erysiphe neolycopersici]|uniref:Uncharacterized protein n=1 Tax=Erysiphe neolycopersici TaxID=212602 RepID=A0A420HE61_9PEZI|nr:hypothetical protein OnM2_087034 [Erysiphe neolycopersici]
MAGDNFITRMEDDWTSFGLGLEWFAGYDSYDVIALTILSQGPSLYLLVAFYDVPLIAILPFLLIDSVVVFVSFRLVRPLSSFRYLSSRREASSRVANSDILSSITIQTHTVLLAALVYAVTIFTAYRTYLPRFLITYFNNLPRISAVHSPFYVTLFPATILVGLAIKTFIFTPAVAISTEDEQDIFDAQTASFWETLWFNIWGYGARTKLVIKRTIIIIIVSGVSTFLNTFLTIDGVEFMGSIAYTALVISASGFSCIALGIVAAAV